MTTAVPVGLVASRPGRWEAARQVPLAIRQRRRVQIIWGLLVLDVLEYVALPTVVHIPSVAAKLITQLSLWVALALAVSVNPRLMVRRSLVLTLMAVLAASAVALSVRGYFGLGSDIRAVRFAGFLAVLWLISPWWGRRDMLLMRTHLSCLALLLGTVVLGVALKPGGAFYEGRLAGSVWPIAPPQVAHYAAVLAGLVVVMWLAGELATRWAALASGVAVLLLLLTHTRTALLALVAGLSLAGLSMLGWRSRVRRTFLAVLVVAGVVAVTLLPLVMAWLARGQNAQELSNFTGRANVWHALITMPRPMLREVFGYGLSNKSFGGLPIDSTWLAVYQDEGLLGDVICGLVFLIVLAMAVSAPRGAARAGALFLVGYCLVASFTEVGLGDASPYMLDLVVAISLLNNQATVGASP